MRSSLILLLTAAAVVAVTALAQQPQPAPTFHADTKLVEVDVVVRDKKGPVAGLTKDDFTLLDNGKPQTISVFSVRSNLIGPAQTQVTASTSVPPGAVSNRASVGSEAPGTETIILIDQKNTSAPDQAFAISRVVRFVETRRKSDKVGIYTFGRDGVLHAIQDLTDDQDRLKIAAGRLSAQDPSYVTSDTTGMSAHAAEGYTVGLLMARAADSRHAFEAVARHVATVPGRKNLIWVTSAFPLVWPARPYEIVDFTEDMDKAARMLSDANVALYAVDARGLIGALQGTTGISNAESGGERPTGPMIIPRPSGPADPSGLDTMRELASLTGGEVYYKTNGIEDSIRTAIQDAELTYVLGFYPALPAKEQSFKNREAHALKVKVDRSGVDIRYRENYSPTNPTDPGNNRPTAEQMLSDTLDATQIGLWAEVVEDKATPDTAQAGAFQVRVSVDLHDVKLERQDASWAGAVDISLLVEGSKGYQKITRKIAIPADQLAAGLEKGVAVETPVKLEGPSGILRVVVQDQATGAAGSLRLTLGRKSQ